MTILRYTFFCCNEKKKREKSPTSGNKVRMYVVWFVKTPSPEGRAESLEDMISKYYIFSVASRETENDVSTTQGTRRRQTEYKMCLGVLGGSV